jgi:hypothetical protein
MGKRMPTADEVADNYVEGGSNAQGKYERGIERTDDWQDATLDGEGNYEDGVKAAIAQKKYGKGVAKVSDAEWKAAAKAKASRLPEGIAAAKGKFQREMAPVLDHIASGVAKLPKRGIAGSPANKARMDQHFEHMKKYKKD